MTRTSIYEKKYGQEDLKISSYYKKDYTSLNTWITLIWVTVGYLLLGGVLFLCYGDALVEGITPVRLFMYGAFAVAFYFVILIIYGIGSANFYSRKHTRAKQRVKRYIRDISRLEKMNNKKEKDRA